MGSLRWCFSGTLLTVVLVACSTFTAAPSTPEADGGIDASSATSDAAAASDSGDPATGDSSADARAGGGRNGCLPTLDPTGAATAGWLPDESGATLMSDTVMGRTALSTTVMPSQHALILHDVSPGAAGAVGLSVDYLVSAEATSFVSWVVELVTLSCTTPTLKVSFLYGPSGLEVDPTPGSGSVSLGAPPTAWSTLDLTVLGSSLIVKTPGTKKTFQLPSSLAGAVGCTVSVGANAVGSVPGTTASYASICGL